MTDNIQWLSETELCFKKIKFDSTELSLARCLNFKVDEEKNEIVCDIRVTTKKSLFEFFKKCFVSLTESPLHKEERDILFGEIKGKYNRLWEYFGREVLSRVKTDGYSFYAHQKEAMFYCYNKQYNLLAMDMGTGKTLTSATLSRLWNCQRTLIICPSVVKWNWYRDLTEKFGFNPLYFTIIDRVKSKSISAYVDERFVIVNYEMIKKFWSKIIEKPINHIICDECFPYDTLVFTRNGYKKIGEIVENSLKEEVLSYDTLNKELEYKKICRFVKKKNNERLVKVNHKSGSFVCTENHKIYTQDGYKKSKELTCNDKLSLLQFSENCEKQRGGDREILQSSMRNKTFDGKWVGREIAFEPRSYGRKIILFDKLSSMWSGKENAEKINIKRLGSFLRNLLFCKMKDATTGDKGESLYRGTKCKSLSSIEEIQFRKSGPGQKEQREDEEKQSSLVSGRTGKNYSEIKGSEILTSRRKWKNHSSATTYSLGYSGINNGVCNKYSSGEKSNDSSSEFIQSRCGLGGEKDSDRSGWGRSFKTKDKGTRFEKRKSIELVGVESIEILELGSRLGHSEMQGENYVYDIEVEDNHNYFAENILVSNCHMLKNHQSARYDNVAELASLFPQAKITLLSGTPVKNRVNDMFAYLKLTKHPLGKNHSYFLREYTNTEFGRGGLRVIGSKNLSDLYSKLSNFMVRYRIDECVDLPSKIISKFYIDMEDWRTEYNRVIDEMMAVNEKFDIHGALSTLNIVISKAKLPGIIQLAENIIEEGRKVVIFSSYHAPMDDLQFRFGESCVRVDGRIDAFEKDKQIQRFWKDDSIKVFLAQTTAAGVGINLTNCHDIIFANFPFVSTDMEQAISRCYRIGQKEKVKVYLPMATDSIDDFIYSMIVDKSADINAVVDRGATNTTDYASVENRLMSKLIERYKPEVQPTDYI